MDLKVGPWQSNYLYLHLGPLSGTLHEQLCQSCLETVPVSLQDNLLLNSFIVFKNTRKHKQREVNLLL